MPTVPEKKALESMKRADLQRLCKDHGLKANLKSEALIELLLEESTSPRLHAPPPQPIPPQRPPSTRAVGRATAPRSRQQSTSSVIIHSDVEDDGGLSPMAESEPEPEPEPEPVLSPQPEAGPSTRTRKAKDTQLRLGVGRPVIAGGAGARTVTKPVSGSRGSRRGKGSQRVRPREDDIPEEGIPEEVEALPEPIPMIVETTPSPAPPSLPPTPQFTVFPVQQPPVNRDALNAIVVEQMRPLREIITQLQEQLRQQAIAHSNEITSLRQRMDSLTGEVREARRGSETVQDMSDALQRLQAEFAQLRMHSTPGSPIHPPVASSSSQALAVPLSAHSPFEYPVAPTRSPAKAASQAHLGKRHRDSDANSISGVVNAADAVGLSAEDLRKMVVRPDRKRVKTDDNDHRTETFVPSSPGPSSRHDDAGPSFIHSTPPPQRQSRFTVFTGPEENIPQPTLEGDIFTEQDFDFFDLPPRTAGAHAPATSTANASENQQPFSFGFPITGHLPMTSTPTATGPAPAIDDSPVPTARLPFPPPRPQSPSPAPTRVMRGGRIERNDRFHPFGTPPPSSSRGPSGSTISALSPSALLRTPPSMTLPDMVDLGSDGQSLRMSIGGSGGRRKASSNDVGAGLGMTTVPGTPGGPTGRTLYGTELQADTRFGDFGVEGVASGYWMNARS